MERHRRNGGKETSPKCRIRRDGAAGPEVNNFRTVAVKWRKLWQRRAISTKVCKYAGRWDNSQRPFTMPVQESSPKGEDDWKQIISTTYRNFYVKTGKITEDIADSVIKIIYNIVGEVGNRKFNILVL